MKSFDYHLHTQFSYDSRIKGTQLVEKAIALSFNEIAITEHLDLLPQELSVYGLPSLKNYMLYCRELQEKYSRLKINMGIEIGDYHLVHDFAQGLIRGFNFYPILGSVHFTSDHINVAIPLQEPLEKAQVLDYYKHNLSLVSCCDIDILAHLGVYKRYYPQMPDESFALPIIDEILKTMIRRNIALEINLSSLRKPYGKIIPEPVFIERYRSLGGKYISIGSDSHHIDHFEAIPAFVLDLCRGFLPPPKRARQ